MKLAPLTITTCVGVAIASPLEQRQASGGAATGGDGPFKPAKYSTETTLAQHTVYMPTGSTGSTKLPVVVWGNGGCSGDGTSSQKLLEQFASYGYLVIASGAPKGASSTTAAMMTASIDWAVKSAGTGAYANVDATKIMAAGFSCGGIEAYAQIWDPRVKTIGIFSSGLLTNYTAAKEFHKPILFCLGGSSDVAYQNGERDFKNLPADTPSWKGNLPVGHGGTLFDANGGKFGRAGLNWLEWIFRGNETAGKFFTADGSKADGWTVETHALDQLKPLTK